MKIQKTNAMRILDKASLLPSLDVVAVSLWIYGTWHTLRTGKSIISAKSIPR